MKRVLFFYGVVNSIAYWFVESLVISVTGIRTALFYLISLVFWLLFAVIITLSYLVIQKVFGRRFAFLSRQGGFLSFILAIYFLFLNSLIIGKTIPGKIYSASNVVALLAFIGFSFILYLLFKKISENNSFFVRIIFFVTSFLALCATVNALYIMPHIIGDPIWKQLMYFFFFELLVPFAVVMFIFHRFTPLKRYEILAIVYVFVIIAFGVIFLPDRKFSRSEVPADTHQRNNPNIIMITLDTLRYDAVVSSDNVTLRKDQFFSQIVAYSVLYTNAYANSNWTVPTHASLLTGMINSHIGVNYIDYSSDLLIPISESQETIGKILQKKGFRTAAFFCEWVFIANERIQ